MLRPRRLWTLWPRDLTLLGIMSPKPTEEVCSVWLQARITNPCYATYASPNLRMLYNSWLAERPKLVSESGLRSSLGRRGSDTGDCRPNR
eukprot:14380861-Alexandrium_andersonii.AAC.1